VEVASSGAGPAILATYSYCFLATADS